MTFRETPLAGCFVVTPERHGDERGFFARTFCAEEFAARGLATGWVQCSVSYNAKVGTLRGMHWQAPPHEEAKLVRCTRGAIYDVVIDMRPESPTYKRWHGERLDEDDRSMLYIPPLLAHGFLTLADGAEVFYQMSAPHHPESACGVRWDDRSFGIRWPERVRILSKRDRDYPDFQTH